MGSVRYKMAQEAYSTPDNMTVTTVDSEDTHVSFQQILPTLVQIFVTMLLGWLTGYYKVVGPSEAKGLNIYVSKFALPSLIFVSMATVDFSQINLAFLLGIFASKVAAFALLLLVQVVIKKDPSAGAVYAMFSTQTNDLGMGVPLLDAVFGKNHIFVSYLYMTGAISLLILNPIGFMILEANNKSGKNQSVWKTVSLVLKGLILNPIVSMTFLGVIANLIFQSNPPVIITLLLSKLGAAFSACAPFTLGLGMVGKFQHIHSQNLPILVGLMIVKCFLSPILSYSMVAECHQAIYGFVDRKLVNFAFLYGTFPTALGVMSYATQYNTNPELVSAGIVLGTILSAPLMYVSAEILKVYDLSIDDHILNSSFNIAISAIIGIVIILAIFIITRRFLCMPHSLTTSLTIQCLISPIASVLGFSNLISVQAQELIHCFGVFSVQITTAVLAIILLRLIQEKETHKVFKSLTLFVGPILTSLVMFLLSITVMYKNSEAQFQATRFDTSLDIAAVFVNLVSLIVTSVALASIHRLKRVRVGTGETKEAEMKMTQKSAQHSKSYTPQIFRHSLLLMLMCCSMIAGVTIPLWRLSTTAQDTDTGAYKVMLSIGKMLSTGQGLLVVSVFFLDWECILNPAKVFLVLVKKKLQNGKEEIPEFPVMLPVVMSNTMRLPVTLLTNIAMSLTQESTADQRSTTALDEDISGTKLNNENIGTQNIKQRRTSTADLVRSTQ